MKASYGLLVFLWCAVCAARPVSLDFWHSMSGAKAKLLQQIVASFNEKYEQRIEVKLQFVGNYEDGLNKLRTALMAKRGPHLIQITDIGTGLLADSGAIRPLQDFVDQDPQFPLNQILAPIRSYYTLSGRLYSLPFATSNPIVYYNAELFEKAGIPRPPENFEQLVAVSRKLTDPATRRTGITWPLHSWFVEQFLARQGQVLVNGDNGRAARPTEIFLTSEPAMRFVGLWLQLVKEGVFANVGRGWEPAEQNFLAGRSAMLITSTSDVFEVIEKAPFRVATAPIPAFDPKIPGGTIIGGNSLWILNSKPEPEQKSAYEFIKFMASAEVQRKWHTNTGYFPIRQDVIDALEREGFYKKHPAANTAIVQLQSSAPIAATRGALLGVFPEVREYIEVAIEQALAGYKEVGPALTRAKRDCEEAMARYNRRRK